MASLSRVRLLALCGLLACAQPLQILAATAAASEDQVKAVFLFNFAHFVEWPPGMFASSSQPFLIDFAGGENLAPLLEQTVGGEVVDGHPMQVRRAGEHEPPGHILFISRSEASKLPRILAGGSPRGTLTVSDLPDSARRGVMIEMVNDKNRIRLRINLAAVRAAGLTISSNLLRPAEIVGPEAR